MHGDESILRGLLDSGRKVLAAFLLILPGIVSDLFGLLLIRCRSTSAADPRRTAAGCAAARSTATGGGSTIPPRNHSEPVLYGRDRDLPGARYAQTIITTPATIIGSDSHWPIDRPSASSPRKVSGSRANSASEANTP